MEVGVVQAPILAMWTRTVLQALHHLDFVKEAVLGYDVLDGLGGNHFMLSDNDALIIHVQQLFQQMRKQESGSTPINSLALHCNSFNTSKSIGCISSSLSVMI